MIEVKISNWFRKTKSVMLYKPDMSTNMHICHGRSGVAALKSTIKELRRLIKVCEAMVKDDS